MVTFSFEHRMVTKIYIARISIVHTYVLITYILKHTCIIITYVDMHVRTYVRVNVRQ